jgi:hypothetical protein
MLVKSVQLLNASPSILVKFGLLGNVTLVRLVKRNACMPMLVTVVLGSTIDTIRRIPSGMTKEETPVMKAPSELLQLADMSRATFLPAVCSAGNSDCLKASLAPIAPKFISIGRNTGAVCNSIYSTKVRFVGCISPVQPREHNSATCILVNEVIVGVVSAQPTQSCPNADSITASGSTTSQPSRVQVPGMLSSVQVAWIVSAKLCPSAG